ncbi:MAG: flippase-like domain-containing protein [Anaerolineaceae bacterium]|nr:flippase-like domain-containing protein [Anaerolineaceae bacterium]
MNKKQKNNLKKTIQWIGTVLSIGLFIWLLTQQDWLQIWEIISQLSVWMLILSLLVTILSRATTALRWNILLRAQQVDIPLRNVIEINFAGLFASNFLPSTIGGDVIRLFSLFNYTQNKAMALASLTLDRLLNVISYFLLFPSIFFTLEFPLQFKFSEIVGLSFVIPLPNKLKEFISKNWRHFWDSYRLWLNQPKELIKAMLYAWLNALLNCFSIWLITDNMGLDLSFINIIAVSWFSYFLTLLPLSINGYGLREIVITFLYTQLGVGLEQATAIAVISRLTITLASFPGAFWLPKLMREITPKIKANQAEDMVSS